MQKPTQVLQLTSPRKRTLKPKGIGQGRRKLRKTSIAAQHSSAPQKVHWVLLDLPNELLLLICSYLSCNSMANFARASRRLKGVVAGSFLSPESHEKVRRYVLSDNTYSFSPLTQLSGEKNPMQWRDITPKYLFYHLIKEPWFTLNKAVSILPRPIAKVAIELLRSEIETEDNEGYRPLHYAAMNKCSENLQQLLSLGANTEATDVYGQTPFFLAVDYERIPSINKLLSSGANAKAKTSYGETVLHFCSLTKRTIQILQEVLDVNTQDYEGRTALHYNTKNCNKSNVRWLLMAGADIEKQDNYGKTPLQYLFYNGKYDWWDPIGTDNNIRDIIILFNNQGLNIRKRDSKGQTLLHYAAEHHYCGCLSELLSLNIAINEVDKNGRTALHLCAMSDRRTGSACIKMLLRHGANVHIRDKHGKTALLYAAERIHPLMIFDGNIAPVITLLEGHTRKLKEKAGTTLCTLSISRQERILIAKKLILEISPHYVDKYSDILAWRDNPNNIVKFKWRELCVL